MLKKEFKKSIVILFIGLIITALICFLMIDKLIFFDIFALILGCYLIIESLYSYSHDNEHASIVYLKIAVGSWFIGEHLHLILIGRCF